MRTTLLTAAAAAATTLLPLLLLLSVADSGEPPFSCGPQANQFGFCRTNLSIRDRARDLVSRLTLDEKISQLANSAPAIPRLGIPAYEWWSEALHGVSDYGRGVSFSGGRITAATSFPQVILSAASFDSRLWYRIGQAIGKEARAMYNAGQTKGLTFWAPNVNIFRDPRWGRGQETPGEDPLVAGKYAVAYVRGIQGDDFDNNDRIGGKISIKKNLQASACCKHFTAYDLDKWNGVTRYAFNAIVTNQDLADTYQPPFEKCIKDGRASGIMCAYNRVNGVPNCADRNLLTNTSRKLWGFHGYITSDCDAVSVIHDSYNYAKLPEDAVADVLNAGMDIDCGTYLQRYTKSAVEQRKLAEFQIDRALHNLFAVRMRLGLFNGDPKDHPFGQIGPDQICSDEHQQLALEAATDGIVLLKNSENLLPFDKSRTRSLAVIGPNARYAYVLLGNYEGPPCQSVEIDRALESYVGELLYHSGCNDGVSCTSADVAGAVDVAKNADRVVLVMGLDNGQEKEDEDRVDLVLPGQQETLVSAVAEASKDPVVLVLVCGGPVDVGFAKDDEKIGGIIWAGYPGEAGGAALAQIIFGEHNPGGKLPMTWYPKEFVRVPMTDMRMRADLATGYPGRTYRFYNGTKVFEFGYGLSYTKYSYEFLASTPNTIDLNRLTSRNSRATGDDDKSPRSLDYLSVSKIGEDACESLKFSARLGVENAGNMYGKHPVLLFVAHEDEAEGSVGGRPERQLAGFESVSLNAGERMEVEFELNPCLHLATANEDGEMVIERGYKRLIVEDKEFAVQVVF
ncbi:Probable beta-D-xylosidase 7 [Striga hermonthica]|uniref:Probable beta-D-xylosidase 7 n=1 Tax=Striga hermonthica TaxID=68872 RepID=A0A9N7P5V4_STRHE|nr:Probable beta-D-xylosidase 7 [Striga hermonthica]